MICVLFGVACAANTNDIGTSKARLAVEASLSDKSDLPGTDLSHDDTTDGDADPSSDTLNASTTNNGLRTVEAGLSQDIDQGCDDFLSKSFYGEEENWSNEAGSDQRMALETNSDIRFAVVQQTPDMIVVFDKGTPVCVDEFKDIEEVMVDVDDQAADALWFAYLNTLRTLTIQPRVSTKTVGLRAPQGSRINPSLAQPGAMSATGSTESGPPWPEPCEPGTAHGLDESNTRSVDLQGGITTNDVTPSDELTNDEA